MVYKWPRHNITTSTKRQTTKTEFHYNTRENYARRMDAYLGLSLRLRPRHLTSFFNCSVAYSMQREQQSIDADDLHNAQRYQAVHNNQV